MRIDSQVSLWRHAPEAAKAHPKFPGADRSFLPEHLEPILVRNRFDGALVFSAGAEAAEVEQLAVWCLESDSILGLSLAWGDAQPQREHLASALEKEVLRGVWVDGGSAEISKAAMYCHRHALALDVRFGNAASAFDAVHQEAILHPEVPFVLAHAGAPPLPAAELTVWMEHMRALAALPNVHAKISGLWSTGLATWDLPTLQSLLTFLVEQFGEHRLLFGSDWPFCLPGRSWKECLARFTQAIGARKIDFREAVLGDNAARVYGIPQPEPLAA